jgi:diacylglycerol O-acyltransferase / wax synthase
MERLTGLDAAFLYAETPTNHMHVSALLIFDPSSMPGGYSFGKVRDYIAGRVHLVPQFTNRLATVPFNLHHPVWFTDPEFDLDHHVRRAALPSPGDEQQLAEFAGEVTSHQLDRNRPLWEIWIVEGLQDGRIAVVAKMHHSTVDGVSGANLMVHLFDLSPEPAEVEAPGDQEPEHKPSDAELVTYALRSRMRRPLVAARALTTTVGALTRVVQRRRSADTPAGATPGTAPRTSFNGAITSRRSVAFSSVPLTDVKEIKNRFGTTVNDVVLEITTGALRRYLGDRGELPDRPLVATCPVSVRMELEGDTNAGANQVSAMFVSLPVHLDDPVERLMAIRETTKGAKEERNAVGARLLLDWAEIPAPNLFAQAARMYSRSRLVERMPVIHNLVVSNVPGPDFPLYFAGGKLEVLHPLGPVFDGAGVNITVLSYLDRVGFGIMACKDLVPRPFEIADAADEATAELLKAAKEASGSPSLS